VTAVRDWHGVARRYVRDDDGACATELRALVRQPLQLDRDGVLAAWGVGDRGYPTVVAGVRQDACEALAPSDEPWADALEAAVAAIARTAVAPAVALGGGVDGAAVLAAWRVSGAPMPRVVTLATGLPDYDEVDDACAIAAALGARCEVVTITPADLVALAPEAAVAAETPLYNLHPVHRLALARAAAALGIATLVTGDGADAAFRGRPDLDYVPIVAALTRAAGLALASPFFAPAVIAAARPLGADARRRPDPTKLLARAYIGAHGIARLAGIQPKRPRLVPPLDLSPIHDPARIATLARSLDLAPGATVGWVTLDHLVRALEAA